MNLLMLILCMGMMAPISMVSWKDLNVKNTFKDETECVKYFPKDHSTAKFCIRQTGVEYHYSFIDAYTFFFPKITLECECTCNLYQPLQACTTDTVSRRRKCDDAQFTTSTCSNVDYGGTQSGCVEFYRMCCQVYFSIRDPHNRRRAFQLRLEHINRIFEMEIPTQNKAFEQVPLTVPSWVKNLIIDRDIMLVINTTQNLQNAYNLNHRWIYYWEISKQFYAGNSINEADQFRFEKMGWFQKDNKNKKMVRINRKQIEDNSHLDAQQCNEHLNQPIYKWNLNATNYHYKNDLKFTMTEVLFDAVYPGLELVSVEDFFNEKPVYVMKTKETYTNFQLSYASAINLYSTADEVNPQNITITIVKIAKGTYDVIVADFVQNRRSVRTFSTNDPISFPYRFTTTCPMDMSCKIVCIQNETIRVCSLIDNNWILKHSPTTNLIQNSTTNETGVNNEYESKTNLTAILLPILVISVLALLFILLHRFATKKSKRRLMTLRNRRQDSSTASTKLSRHNHLESQNTDEPDGSYLLHDTSNADFSNINQEENQSPENKNWTKEDITRLRKRLTDLYSNLSIPQPPGINKHLFSDELFMNQEMEKYYKDTNKKEVKETLQLEDLFKHRNEAQNVSRILVEGNPGYGKTTLAIKIATEWAKGNKHLSSLFSLTLLIPLREVEDQQLEDVIVGIINKGIGKEVITKDDLKHFCDDNKVLLLLDGFDELTPLARKDTESLLLLQVLASCCILVTSRRGIFANRKTTKYSGEYLFFKKDTLMYNYEDWDTHVVLTGLSEEKRNTFLSQQFDIDKDKLQSKMKEWVTYDAENLFRSPLLIFWLGWMMESKKILSIETRTQFYKALFNLILHKTLAREKVLHETDHFDIFTASNNKVIQSLRNEMCQLGELAVERLIQHDLSFTENDLHHLLGSSLLLKSDIMIKYKSVIKTEEDTYYQPTHKTFLEFLAAFNIWSCKDNEPDRFNQFQKKIRDVAKRGLVPSEESLFFPFLAGLMEDEAYWVFQSLLPWAPLYHACTRDMGTVLLELSKVNDNIIQSLAKFIPRIYPIKCVHGIPATFYSTPYHRKLLKRVMQYTPVMSWDLSALNHLPAVKVKVEVLYLRSSFNFPCSNSQVESVQCDELVCYVIDNMDQNCWDSYLSIYNTIKTDQRHVCVNDCNASTCTMILNELMRGEWCGKSFQRVRLSFCSLVNDHLEKLIQLVRKQIITKGIFVSIDEKAVLGKDMLSQLWDAVVHSSIDEFTVINHNSKVVPVFDFTCIADGQRTNPFQMIDLRGSFTVKLTTPFHSKKLIRGLVLNNENFNCDEEQEMIRPTEDKDGIANLLATIHDLQFLECASHSFCAILSSSEKPNRSAFSSLKELHLFVRQDFSLPSSFCVEKQMPSLRSLMLNFEHLKLTRIPSSLNGFVSSILRTNQLQLLGIATNSSCIFDSFMSFLSSQRPSLECLELWCSGNCKRELSDKSLSPVKDLMCQKLLKCVALVDFGDRSFIPLRTVLISVFPERQFEFKSQLHGHKDDDSVTSRSYLKRFMNPFYRFKVELKNQNDTN